MSLERYTRQISLPSFGEEAQQKLLKARVLVIGVGGLGIPVLQYLNAMGVGILGMVEQDVIELSNLQRQVLYTEADLGKQKLQVALEKLRSANSETTFEIYDTFVTRENALEIITSFDIVVDATDNFPTRYLVNDACVILNKPLVYGALHGFEGHVSVFNYQGGPTYRCLFPDPPNKNTIPNCNEHGVLGVLPGIIGNLQALEVIKCLTGVGEVLSGKLLLYKGLNQSIYKIDFPIVPINKQRTTLEDHYETPDCTTGHEITIAAFKEMTKTSNSRQLIDVRTQEEFNEDPMKDAINIPLSDLESFMHNLDVSRPVYFVCQVGMRSLQAVHLVRDKFPEYTSFSIKGGVDLWRSADKSSQLSNGI
ncbi:MAG: HesA/MoeB/ThiF family protein [Muriicola sp.]|nr:HesA/MoeB/ThiF family protein [Muriicola sp.]